MPMNKKDYTFEREELANTFDEYSNMLAADESHELTADKIRGEALLKLTTVAIGKAAPNLPPAAMENIVKATITAYKRAARR